MSNLMSMGNRQRAPLLEGRQALRPRQELEFPEYEQRKDYIENVIHGLERQVERGGQGNR